MFRNCQLNSTASQYFKCVDFNLTKKKEATTTITKATTTTIVTATIATAKSNYIKKIVFKVGNEVFIQ